MILLFVKLFCVVLGRLFHVMHFIRHSISVLHFRNLKFHRSEQKFKINLLSSSPSMTVLWNVTQCNSNSCFWTNVFTKYTDSHPRSQSSEYFLVWDFQYSVWTVISTVTTETDKNLHIWSVISETEQYFNKFTSIYHNRLL